MCGPRVLVAALAKSRFLGFARNDNSLGVGHKKGSANGALPDIALCRDSCVVLGGWLAFALDDWGSGSAAGSFGGDLSHLFAEGGLVHDELLGDAEEVSDGPVEAEAGAVADDEVAGDERHHEGHHLLLLRVDAGGGRVELHQELADDHDGGDDVVRVRRGEVGQPGPVRVAQLDDLGEHGEEGEEQGQLDEHRDAAAEHVHSVVLLELHDLHVHLVALGVVDLVLLVLLLDGVHLGLDALHLEAGLHGLDAQREQKHVDAEGEKDDGPSPVADVVRVDPLEDEEEDLTDRSPEAEVVQGLERDALSL